MTWVRQLRFEHPAQEFTRLDYLHEVEHMAERVLRLEQAITDAIRLASAQTQEVIRGLQALRGIVEIFPSRARARSCGGASSAVSSRRREDSR
jgi:transposase